MNQSNLHVAWARLLFEGLVAAGVQDVVLSPGSRSTPLALAAAAVEGLRVHVVLDERQAGFFALGQARVTGRPSVVVCTSGTAAAHYLPCLLEAREAGVPIVVLTADRPWEAHHVHSSQTTDQIKLFGDAVRGFFALGTPEPDALALAAVARTAAQAVALARGPVPGGVHVNAPFRKPLEPVPGLAVPPLASAPTLRLDTESRLNAPSRQMLQQLLGASRRPLFLAGPASEHAVGAVESALAAVLERTGGVLIAEASSGLRSQASLAHGEALLPLLEGDRAPDLVIQLGLPVVATGLQSWLARSSIPRVVVAPYGWPDPWSKATMLMPLGVASALEAIVEAWSQTADSSWRGALHAADATLSRALGEAFETGALGHAGALSEPAIARSLALALPEAATLVIGNSLPVRDLDMFGGTLPCRCVHQRGVAGIDGLLAGAAGVASISGHPVALYVGDVSFLHDAGALALLSRVRSPLVVLAVNNDGGRIFHELPLARQPELARAVESLFVTPHGHSLAAVAAGFGVAAERVARLADLERVLREAQQAPHATVVEAVVAPEQGSALRKLWSELARSTASACLARASA